MYDISPLVLSVLYETKLKN